MSRQKECGYVGISNPSCFTSNKGEIERQSGEDGNRDEDDTKELGTKIDDERRKVTSHKRRPPCISQREALRMRDMCLTRYGARS